MGNPDFPCLQRYALRFLRVSLCKWEKSDTCSLSLILHTQEILVLNWAPQAPEGHVWGSWRIQAALSCPCSLATEQIDAQCNKMALFTLPDVAQQMFMMVQMSHRAKSVSTLMVTTLVALNIFLHCIIRLCSMLLPKFCFQSKNLSAILIVIYFTMS